MRHTRIGLLAATAAGTVGIAVPAAVASPVDRIPPRPHTRPSPPTAVTVRAGDTLSGIATRVHRSWPQLAAWNRLPDPDLIVTGEQIRVPAAGYVPPPVVVAARPTVPVGSHTVSVGSPTVSVNTNPGSSVPVVSHPLSGPPASGGFQACVAWRESTNGTLSSDVYGILPSTWAGLGRSGSPYTASRAEQDQAFAQLYARDGTRPWRPYDGC